MSDPVIPDPSSSEPLVSVGTITAIATAVVGLFVAFGLPLTADQKAGILGVIGVVAPVVVAVWGRRRVYSPATVHKLLGARRP